MLIGGILDISTVDYPGKLCSVIFFAGCPFRCPYCQNYKLLEGGVKVDVDFIVDKIRKNYLVDGVCFTGGEPLMQEINELLVLIKKLKNLGFSIKVDTNGYYPDKLAKIVEYVDYIAIDIKTVPEKYSKVTGKKNSAEKVLKSLNILVEAGIPFEARTTVVPTIVDEKDINKIAKILSNIGVKKYVLQQFRNEDVLDPTFRNINPFSKDYLIHLGKTIKKFNLDVIIRCEGEIKV
ncbi:MAG TPA: anaerobic ribonucleoside-triphosphate reductase activating protein [Archaeoglobus profundus]|nr:anaerobic ribonucleoside-triphosphate reductase activating protein [Archaeoglobus profundus]